MAAFQKKMENDIFRNTVLSWIDYKSRGCLHHKNKQKKKKQDNNSGYIIY